MDTDKQEMVASFCSITSAKAEQAAFFLESSNWDLDSAISSFFDQDGHADLGLQAATHQREELEPLSSGQPSNQEEHGPRSQTFGQAASATRGRSSQAASRAASSSRFKTVSDLNKVQEDNDEDDDEEPNEYYTGGEKSGMMVQDPKRGGRTPNVDAIFERARQFGARDGDAEDLESPEVRRGGAFSGRARTLGASPEDSVEGAQPVALERPKSNRYTITFWRNGFTVDDGPLRRLEDPANSSFLTSINRGECPRELAPPDRVSPVEVNLVRKDEDWTPPPEPRYVAFSGVGRTLGGFAVATEPSPTLSTSNASTRQGLVVDDTKPSTSVQLRLADGSRMVARFNLDHTVGDIRAFIESSRPSSNSTYQLQSMGFPPKPLTDPSETIEAAGLVNSVVLQR